MENFFTISEKDARNLIRKSGFRSDSNFLVRSCNNSEFKVIISVKKKDFKKAVVRNRIKRRIRYFVRNKMNKKGFHLIIIKKSFKPEMPFSLLCDSLSKLL